MADWSKIVLCGRCGKGNPSGAAACLNCGHRLRPRFKWALEWVLGKARETPPESLPQQVMRCPKWDALCDAAYARWQRGDLQGTTYREFVDALSPSARKAVLLRNLHWQVKNGGFYQWIHNGYGLHVAEIVPILDEIGTQASATVRSLLRGLLPLINTEKEDMGCRVFVSQLNAESWNLPAVRDVLVRGDPEWADAPPEELGMPMQDFCAKPSAVYFSVADQFASDVEGWLQTQAEGQASGPGLLS